VADKSSQLVLTALSRAMAEAVGLPLHGSRTAPGLFAATPLGRQAAQRCVEEGYLRLLDSSEADPTAHKGKAPPDLCVLTDKGRAYLLGQLSPRQVLEDFVRVLEARQTQADELLTLARSMQTNLGALKANADKALDRLAAGTDSPLFLPHHLNGEANGATQRIPQPPDETAEYLTHLARWQSSGAPEDCPLPELFRRLAAETPGLTIGRFHDVLRRLHDVDQIYLHPWTGPLYAVPEPSYALLVGHEVAYYASQRSGE
jgi:hypothetical protein